MAPDPAAAAFASSFFGGQGADPAVTEYIAGLLESLWEEELPAEEAGAQVVDFLPAGADPAAMLAAAAELWSVLAGEGRPSSEPPAWLQKPAEAEAAAEEPAPAAAAALAATVEEPLPGRPEFNVQAVEFAMPAAPAEDEGGWPGAERLAGLSLEAEPEALGDAAAWEAFEAEQRPAAAGWEEGNGFSSTEFGGGGGYDLPAGRPRAAALEAPLESAHEAEAFLAVLEQQFPLYSSLALAELFQIQGRSPGATIDALYALEAEVEGQRHSRHSSSSTSSSCGIPPAQQRPAAPPAPSLGEGDFPTLGGGGGPAAAQPGWLAPTGNYAGRAKAAAALPQPARQPAAAAGGRGGGAGGITRSAPVWQAEERVQRFATGAAVAAEYAEQRGAARDHARLRNAYFQQATAAYLSGNRAAARELGAKGRWHGAQMAAAHAAAADHIFASRNAPQGILGAQGGVPTLDLHGLHVSEALARVESALTMRSRVRLVVGVGQHGKVPARLPAAVRRLLAERGVPFCEPYAGLLEVSPH